VGLGPHCGRAWALCRDLLQANPMDRIDTVKVPKN
jgi:hypothetical protein